MRTTLVLEDHLLQRARIEAARAGLNLSQFVGQALAAALARPVQPPPAGRFVLPTYGGAQPEHHEPAEFAAADDEPWLPGGR